MSDETTSESPPLPDWAVALLYLLILAGAMLVLGPKAFGAPAPVAKPAPPLDKRVEGGWRVSWGTSEGTCYLSPQGFWGCTLGGTVWHGHWTLDGKTLTIVEHLLSDPESRESTWTVVLDEEPVRGGGAVGVINGGTAFVLRPDPATRR